MLAVKRKSIILKALPYSFKLFIRFCDYKEAEKWLRRYGEKDSLKELKGLMYPHPTKSKIFIWFPPKAPINDIVHEFVHAAVFTLKESGVPITATNDEALAYLVDRLLKEYLVKVERKNRAEMKLAAGY